MPRPRKNPVKSLRLNELQEQSASQALKRIKKEARQVGRPTDYSPELAQIVCQLIAEGFTFKEISAAPEMPAGSTLFRWLHEHTEFEEQYLRAMATRTHGLVHEIIEISDQADPETVHVARLRTDVRKWLASKLGHKHYGDYVGRVDLTVNGPLVIGWRGEQDDKQVIDITSEPVTNQPTIEDKRKG